MAPTVLSKGAVKRIYDGETSIKPRLQVIAIKKATSTAIVIGPERYKVTLSDGVHQLLTQWPLVLNDHIRRKTVKEHSIVQLQEFTCSTVRRAKVAQVIKLQLLGYCANRIGDPQPFPLPDPPKGSANAGRASPSSDSTDSSHTSESDNSQESPSEQPSVDSARQSAEDKRRFKNLRKGALSGGGDRTANTNTCAVCFAAPATAAFLHGHTAHQSCCFSCAHAWRIRSNKCPICRVKAEAVIKVYRNL